MPTPLLNSWYLGDFPLCINSLLDTVYFQLVTSGWIAPGVSQVVEMQFCFELQFTLWVLVLFCCAFSLKCSLYGALNYLVGAVILQITGLYVCFCCACIFLGDDNSPAIIKDVPLCPATSQLGPAVWSRFVCPGRSVEMCTSRPSLELEGKQWHSFCLTYLKMKHSVTKGYSLTAQRYTRAVLCGSDVITFDRTSVKNNENYLENKSDSIFL